MSILTDYFLADPQQLASAFAGWLTVADEPVQHESKNPFTGDMTAVSEWQPAAPLGEGPPADQPDLSPLPHVRIKGVELVKLAQLAVLIENKSFDGDFDGAFEDAFNWLAKPALIHPESEETGLHQLPETLTAALSHLTAAQAASTAAAWAATEAMRLDRFTEADCASAINALRSLAAQRRAPLKDAPLKPSDQRMFLLWSL